MPSVIDYINYDKLYFAFGNSVFKRIVTDIACNVPTHFAISYLNDSYQLITKRLCSRFDGKNVTAIYDRKTDPSLKQ